MPNKTRRHDGFIINPHDSSFRFRVSSELRPDIEHVVDLDFLGPARGGHRFHLHHLVLVPRTVVHHQGDLLLFGQESVFPGGDRSGEDGEPQVVGEGDAGGRERTVEVFDLEIEGDGAARRHRVVGERLCQNA